MNELGMTAFLVEKIKKILLCEKKRQSDGEKNAEDRKGKNVFCSRLC